MVQGRLEAKGISNTSSSVMTVFCFATEEGRSSTRRYYYAGLVLRLVDTFNDAMQ